MGKKRENTERKDFWIASETLVYQVMNVGLFMFRGTGDLPQSEQLEALEYVRNGFRVGEANTISLGSGWHLEAIFRSFLYHTWSSPWGRLVYQASIPAMPSSPVFDTTLSPIPYFLLPCECIHCQKPFLRKGDYKAAKRNPQLRCPGCKRKSPETYNKVLANVNRAKERFSRQRKPASQTEMFGELMAAYGLLEDYIQKPYTPRYTLLEPFDRVSSDWLFDLYKARNFDFRQVGRDLGISLFPESEPDLILADDYYSKRYRKKLEDKKKMLVSRKALEMDGFFAPWELSLELLDFLVDSQLRAHV